MRRTDYLKASPPMFQSRLLDRFTRVHPAVPVLIYAPVIVSCSSLGRPGRAGGTRSGSSSCGYALWTLFEYWLHRIVFHFEPEDGIGARLHWMIHGVHHDHPNDPLRLVMPPAASIPLRSSSSARSGWSLGAVHAPGVGRRLPDRLPGLRRDPLPPAPPHAHDARSASGCASCTCATTSRTTRSGFGISAPYWDVVFRTYRAARRAGDGTRPGSRHAVAPVSQFEEDGRRGRRRAAGGRRDRARSRPAAPARSVPARQAAALAATGFVAGAATVAVVHRRRSRMPRRKRRKHGGAIGEIVSSNSFLVDVHLLRRD